MNTLEMKYFLLTMDAMLDEEQPEKSVKKAKAIIRETLDMKKGLFDKENN